MQLVFLTLNVIYLYNCQDIQQPSDAVDLISLTEGLRIMRQNINESALEFMLSQIHIEYRVTIFFLSKDQSSE